MSNIEQERVNIKYIPGAETMLRAQIEEFIIDPLERGYIYETIGQYFMEHEAELKDSKEPINVKIGFIKIDDTELHQIIAKSL